MPIKSLVPFSKIFAQISQPHQDQIKEFHSKHQALMQDMPASVKYHHRWSGGYYCHVLEVCNNAWRLFQFAPEGNFTLSDLLIAAYFHDVDKLFCRYVRDTEPPSSAQSGYAKGLGIVMDPKETKSSISAKIDAAKNGKPLNQRDISYFTIRKDVPSFVDTAMVFAILGRYGISVSDNVVHAVSLHQGGWTEGLGRGAEMGPMSSILHAADLISANCQNGSVLEEPRLAEAN